MKHVAILAVALLASLSTLRADEARLRALLNALDYDAVVREFEASTAPTVAERALYVTALGRLQAGGRAAAEAAKLRSEHPDDAWSWYAAAIAADSPREALPATEKMMVLAGERLDVEMVRIRGRTLFDSNKRDEALALLDTQPRTAQMLVVRVTLLNYGRAPKDFDSQTYALLDEARALDPENIEALYRTGSLMRAEGRHAEALALLEKAGALTNSSLVHRELWAALRSRKRDAVPAAIEALLARDANPGVLLAAADAYYDLGNKEMYEELHARILREAPASIAAQWVLNYRYAKAPREGGAALAAARAYVAWPHHYEPRLLANAYRNLFSVIRDDPAAEDAELLAAIRGMRPIARTQPANLYSEAAISLANRKLALDEAETLAREGLAEVEPHLETLRARGFAQFEEVAAMQRGALRDALGWVLLQRGKKRDAEKELLAAWELHKTSPLIPYHLGRLYESQKKLTKAEEMYRKGFLMPSPRANPNADALRALYQRRFGSLEGFEESLKNAKTFDADARREKILAGRMKKAVSPFKLKTLDGKLVTLADLKGKIAVINVWAVWCGPCVREMPAIQELAKKYATDQKVAVVTLNTDDDAEKVRRWMAEKKYDFPVLLDDGYARKQVMGYPTTWFLHPAGTIAFEKLGESEKLVEEFSWRIEALR